ncbi:MAG TPA: PAS domain S-box protein [Burkholderiales bacterium]|nr:PAS domain S-box protein [Burkholderiales bacterium]
MSDLDFMRHTVAVHAAVPRETAAYARLLEECGYRVLDMAPSEDAWAEADLLLVDEAIATRHGEVLDALKRRDGDRFLPCVLVLPAQADSAQWLDAGFDDVVRLPAQRSEVLARLRVLLRLREHSLEAERLSTARNDMIVASSIDAVIAVDHRGRIVDFNPAAESMFQYPREAVLGESFELLAEERYRARYAESFHRYVVTGRSKIPSRRTELRGRRASGVRFPAELSLTRVEGRSAPTFYAFVRDLTERKRAERGLAHLAAIVESSEEAIFSQSLNGIITSWNKGAERLFGYTNEEAIGKHADMLLPPGQTRAQSDPAPLAPRRVDVDARRRRKDGSLVDVAVRTSPLLGTDGAVIGVSTIAYDISVRKRERIALQESEQRYRSLVAAMTSVVWTSDGEGRFAVPQSSWEAYTGQQWPAHEGWGWSGMLHPSDRLGIAQRWAAAITARRIYEEGCRVWHARTMSYRHVIMRAVPIRRDDGTVRECIGTLTDVDAAKRAEDAIRALNQELEQRVIARTADLAEANRELEAFSYSVSHDLRAPLRAIEGFTSILLDDYAPRLDEEGTRLMERVISNVQRMDELVTDLLTFSRMSRVPISKRTVAPGQMVREIVAEFVAASPERRFDVRIGTLPPCSADASLLRQVFVNLIANAFKYSADRDPAVITVDCISDDDPLKPLVYVVRDNGTGFDMRYAAKLFEVFERLHNRQDIEGTGVGLALVRRIVERHGGRVWAESAPQQGASFYFTLEPDSQADAAALRHSSAA